MQQNWIEKKNQYEQYIHSSNWRKKANERLEKDNFLCQVCGKTASEVHHFSYTNLGNEALDDLVSLCKDCHAKAEEIYTSAKMSWSSGKLPEKNFMASVRYDAAKLASIIFDYLLKARGNDFNALMWFRQPDDVEKRHYWIRLKEAVNALCRKRYTLLLVEDRMSIILPVIENHVISICLQRIEHYVRNMIQSNLHQIVFEEYSSEKKWKLVAEKLNITNGTLQKLKIDDGSSKGPSLREEILHFCSLDAASGIKPLENFQCLTEEDYMNLNKYADYIISVSSVERKESTQNE